MKFRKRILPISILCFFLLSSLVELNAQSRRDLLLDGDFYYEMQVYSDATISYSEASKKEADFQSLFNLAVSQEMQIAGEDQTAQQAMTEPEPDPFAKSAIENYQAALNYEHDDTQESLTYYNLGNTIMKDKANLSIEQMEQAIDYYKSAIKKDRNNDPARHNLTITQVMLDRAKKQQQEQQDQQQQDQENQDQENKEEEQQEEQQQDSEEQKKVEQKEQEKSKEEQKKKEEEKKQAEQKKIDQKEIENILKMIEKNDKEVQSKMRKKSKTNHTQKKKKW